jgi:hypothetical protein
MAKILKSSCESFENIASASDGLLRANTLTLESRARKKSAPVSIGCWLMHTAGVSMR